MEQFTETNLFELDLKDRFYFSDDRHKKVWEITKMERKPLKRGSWAQAQSGNKIKDFKSDKKVVFLRNAENN